MTKPYMNDVKMNGTMEMRGDDDTETISEK